MEPKTELTAEECFESLTGYDEIAITKAFGKEIATLAEHHPTTFVRALTFAHLRRDAIADGAQAGTPLDAEVKERVMQMPLAEANGYFTPEPDDLDPTDPDSEAGKDAGSARLPHDA